MRCNNNAVLYQQTLRQLAQQYQQGLNLQAKYFAQIKQLAHSIKGTAANIGAEKLSALAKEMEQNVTAKHGVE